MKKIYIPDWAVEGPEDLEYRRYKMLAEVKSLKKDLLDSKLEKALNVVDSTLDFLYRYDAERIVKDENLSNYELTGINLSDFSLEYTHKDIEQDIIMDALCDEAIDLFEDLHTLIRDIWRKIEEGVNIAYVPSKKLLLNDGFVFIITSDNKIHSYYFTKPGKYTTDWNSFKLEYLNTQKYSKKVYFKQLDEIMYEDTDKIVFKVSCNNLDQIEGHALTVIKSMLYIRLKKDYLF